ncbi:LysR substrate-binding domain-containing protein [Mycobacterium sp. 236(2023)]|uniref:LysR family transcriptional regulator n=1 Tax=Mycobacterium sp. 236(2023) TaxID=3038163 RepID=UPI0024153106|nr:LysR substrate-binding domain-containing protein [Mycobacterium sp. 236(2023)]MDG4663745.1 LysR substrate-binding domain-containing protein [Mycobacterium sp. 236(2023)]
MADFTLEGLTVCREVALRGSFSAAARALGYSQPAVSRQIAAIESAAGHQLFLRELRGVTLTPAGVRVVEHAARILNEVAALEHDLERVDDALAGRVAVGAFPAAMAALVPRAVALLADAHPGMAVTLTEAATPTLLRDLRSGRVDVAVIGVGSGLPDYDLDGLHQYRVYAGDLCVAVPAGHRLGEATSVPVRELVDETWIAGTGSAGDPQFAAWPTLSEPVIGHRVRSWPARLGLVAAGLGVCLLPALASTAVPAGVWCIDVDDPAWEGRRTLAITAPTAGEPTLAVVEALRSAADGIARPEKSLH